MLYLFFVAFHFDDNHRNWWLYYGWLAIAGVVVSAMAVIEKVEGRMGKRPEREKQPWSTYRPQETWENVFAERCTPERKCESAARARIWLDKGNPNDKRVSGKYEVDFGALHLAGQFHLRYRKDKKWICE